MKSDKILFRCDVPLSKNPFRRNKGVPPDGDPIDLLVFKSPLTEESFNTRHYSFRNLA